MEHSIMDGAFHVIRMSRGRGVQGGSVPGVFPRMVQIAQVEAPSYGKHHPHSYEDIMVGACPGCSVHSYAYVGYIGSLA